jgi:hypothetical protein
MQRRMRYQALMILFMIGQLLFKGLTFAVGVLLMSAAGLLIVQHYWLAMLVLTLAVLLYEGGYWLLVGRWIP